MRVFHDSRDAAYRAPFGAVAVGSTVELTLDVHDAPGSTAVVRTWVDGVGEELHEMKAVAPAGEGEGDGAMEVPTRYRAALSPGRAGIVWYQFLITDAEGRIWRYGAKNGQLGGEGQLVGWEPPSFCLSAYDPDGAAPAWYEPIGGFLYDGAHHETREIAAALCENYPAALARTATAWDWEGGVFAMPAELPDLEQALASATEDSCSWFATENDVFGFWRAGADGCMTCALFNPSTSETHAISVPMAGEAVSELVAGYAVDIAEAARVALRPMGEAVLHFHGKARLARPPEAGLGVLAHITSLPAKDGGPGTLGAPARAFVDWLAEAGVRYWQVLPASPTDEYGSPYAGISAFAGNTRLLEGGGPTADELDGIGALPAYAQFCEREADWLEPYACFMAIRQKVGAGIAWQAWPKKYRRYSPKLLAGDDGLARAAETVRRSQFLFQRQWDAVRAYANGRGIEIIGDMPIYVSADSADAWAHPELFQLGTDGLPHVVAGCPPDAFAEEGQVWGNPVYDWDTLSERGYDWWLRRLERAFALYDYVRLDHFIGFSRYFCIPAGEKAAKGAYRLGPGFGFFELAHERFGKLPIIAEDLGLITPRVRALVAASGFPGMDIVQFADGGDPLGGYAPRPEKIVYTGTHDNQTLLGYVRSRYPQADEAEAFESLMRKVVECAAPVRIVPLQDVLGLGDEARMNVPGVAEGNWSWQADMADVEAALGRLREYAKLRLEES